MCRDPQVRVGSGIPVRHSRMRIRCCHVRLVLGDGTEMTGFGSAKPVLGEMVFSNGMAGYIEVLTDPSHRGHILFLTYPLIRQRGVPDPRPPASLGRPLESDRIQVRGLVVKQYAAKYSHHAANRSPGDWLKREDVAAITGIDMGALKCAGIARQRQD